MTAPRRRTVRFDWDYGYKLPLKGWDNYERRLSAGLIADLKEWLHYWEAGNPSDPDWPPDRPVWLARGRALRDRVQKELGAAVLVIFPMHEAEVLDVFTRWLLDHDWTVQGAASYADLVAECPGANARSSKPEATLSLHRKTSTSCTAGCSAGCNPQRKAPDTPSSYQRAWHHWLFRCPEKCGRC